MIYIYVFIIIFVVSLIYQIAKSDCKIKYGPHKYFFVGKTDVYPLDKYPGEVLEFPIAGIGYQKNIDNYLGEFVGTLKAEPRNKYDKNAIKVIALDGHKVGYVPRNMTSDVRWYRELPCTCFCFIAKTSDGYLSKCYINTPSISPKP